MVTEKKFCTTCQMYKLYHLGLKVKGSCRAWRCQACAEKRSPSIYMGQKTRNRLINELVKESQNENI